MTAHHANLIVCLAGLILAASLMRVSPVLGGLLAGWYIVSGARTTQAMDKAKRPKA